MLASALFLTLLPTAAHATTYEISWSASMVPQPGMPVFGQSSDFEVSGSFSVDDAAAPVVVVPSGTGSWTGPTLYGYQRSAISMPDIAVGTATFTKSELVARVPAAGFSADVWFDAPLAPGAAVEMWAYFSNASGTFQLGGGVCGNPCYFYDRADARDNRSFATAFGTPLDITVEGGFSVGAFYTVAGTRNLFYVHGAPAGATVYFGWSSRIGVGPCPAILGGACLDLVAPQTLGSATVNLRGDAWLIAELPAFLGIGSDIYLQAAVPAGAASLVAPVQTYTVEAP